MAKRLSETHKDQIKTMAREGAEPNGIADYMNETYGKYGIKVTPATVKYVAKKELKAWKKANKAKTGRRQAKRAPVFDMTNEASRESVDQMVADIKAIIASLAKGVDMLNETHKATLKEIRGALIQSRQQLKDMNPKFNPDEAVE